MMTDRTLRFIYGCLQKSVQQKWPNNTTMRTRVVRYVCALAAPPPVDQNFQCLAFTCSSPPSVVLSF